MKIYKNCAGIIAVVVVFSFSAVHVHAAQVPTMSVSAIVGGTTAQVTVFGADPNASVLLDYPGTASVTSLNIGTTNASGYLTEVVDAAARNIASGASVYVTVDGQASQSVVWPNYTATSGTLPLSETSAILTTGQSTVISAGVSGALSMTANTNPSVATASINGNNITVTGFNSGTTNITVCASGLGCASIQVTVQSSSAASNVSLSQGTVNVAVGQSQTVSIAGSGSYYVSSNANPAIASANLTGSTLTIGGVVAGSDTVAICSSGGGSVTCASLTVNVTPSSSSVTPSTTLANLTFSQSSINISVGQSQAVTVYGGAGAYYVSTNQAPSSAIANVSGTSVNVTGEAFGGDNITVCSVNGQCGTFYVYVTSSNTTSAPSAGISGTLTAPALTSFSMASNDLNGNFIGAGNALTLTFSANQSINIPQMTVGNSSFAASGSGNGPYTATYTMTGNETLPLPVAIAFSNPAGTAGTAKFWIGTTASAVPVSSATAPVSSAGVAGTFTQYLYNGSTGPQVTALQERLKSDGIYSGPVTGTFGNLTEAAVKTYQARHDVEQLGVVGPATRVLLNQGI